MALSKFNVGESAPGVPVYVYGLAGNVEYMFGEAELVSAAAPSVAATTMPGGKRRMFPGDSGYTRQSHARIFLRDPGVRYGQGIPGRSFIVANWDAEGVLIQRRRFSSTASVRALNGLLRGHFLATPAMGKIMKHYAKGGGVHTFERPAP